MKYDMVIARYNEDISWLEEFNHPPYRIIIYNKGETKPEVPYPIIQQKNLGGDAHAYISHIVSNYDTLAEYSIFLQAYPFDHCSALIEKIKEHTDSPFVPLGDHICKESIQGWYEYLIQRRPPEYPVYLLKDSARAILGGEVPSQVTFCAGQQFILSRDLIRVRTKEFYQKILERFEFDFILPWHVERLWYYILEVM